jgi:hypothetical protein
MKEEVRSGVTVRFHVVAQSCRAISLMAATRLLSVWNALLTKVSNNGGMDMNLMEADS